MDFTEAPATRHRGQIALHILIVSALWVWWLQCGTELQTVKAQESSVSPSINDRQTTLLEQGKPIARGLTGGEVHAYSIQLTAGQFAKVIVNQSGVDLVVIAFEPDGKQLAWVDSPTAGQGPETVLLAAVTSGSYRLELRSVEVMSAGGLYEVNAAGRYEVKIDTLRSTVPDDKRLLEIFELDNRASYQAYVAYRQERAGNLTDALEAYGKSLPGSEATGNKPQLVYTLTSMGRLNFVKGNYATALECYRRSLSLSEEMANQRQVAIALANMSMVHRNAGDLGQALECAQRSLAMHESQGDKLGAANAHISVGLAYRSLGDARALEHYRAALALSEQLGAKGLMANALDKIARGYLEHGNDVQALEYAEKSLQLSEKGKIYRQTIWTITTIGNIHANRGESAQALLSWEKALSQAKVRGYQQDAAEVLARISSHHNSMGNYSQALEAANSAVGIAGQIGNHQLLLHALNNAAFSYLSLNQLDNARRASERAIELVESLRASVAGNEARAGYFATARYPYELNIEVLMQLHKQLPAEGYDAMALEVSERARARTLLETLSEANADIRRGVDPVLLTSERTLQQRLNATAELQTRLLGGKHSEEQAAGLRKEIDTLTSDYLQVQAQIRQSSPRYAALMQPAPISRLEIQNSLLDAETALLEYALGSERSHLWVVTPTTIKSFELPKRAEIETSVRRVIALLSDGKRWTTDPQIEKEYAEASGRLSRTILPSALMSQLKVKRLVIVADGALQYVPFGALPSLRAKAQNPKTTNRQRTVQTLWPLIADYEIISLPSASTLAVLRHETAKRARPVKSVAVLADPVFEESDGRVKAAKAGTHQAGNGRTVQPTQETSLGLEINARALLRAREFYLTEATPEQLRIARLPFTRLEAESILAFTPKSQSLKATDFRANRDTAFSPELAQYRIVHFATHGILNTEHPELSGLVLSLIDELGQPTDGFLRLNEIYNLNLPADLVVLSGCQTGLGKEIRGEGLVSLTRGFMYAGAPRVVASLWKVDDAATAELMGKLYRGILKDKLSPAAGLRAARLEMWRQKRWSAPFYWGAFELQGEWKQ